MKPIKLAFVLVQVGTTLGISPSLIREIWSILPRYQKTGNYLDDGVKLVGMDLHGHLAVREYTRESAHVLDIVSTSDVKTALVRLVPYDLQAVNGQFALLLEYFASNASFSLDNQLVAVAIFRHGTYTIIVFDVRTGQEVKLLHANIPYIGHTNRLSFGTKTLYLATIYVGYRRDLKAWDVQTWTQCKNIKQIAPESRYIAPLHVGGQIHLTSAINSDPTAPVPTLAVTNTADCLVIQTNAPRFVHRLYDTDAWGVMLHYRADLDALWIVCEVEDPQYSKGTQWQLSERDVRFNRVRWAVEVEERPCEIAISESGTWVTLAGPHTIVRLNRRTLCAH